MANRPAHSKHADLDALMPSLSQAVRERGAISIAHLTKFGVPRVQHQSAAARLKDEGFEATTKVIRQPIRQQLLRRLGERGLLPLKGLQKLVFGSTAREVLAVAAELVKNGQAYRVLRTRADWIVSKGTDVLSDDEVETLHRAVSNWAAQTKKARSAKQQTVTFWRDDVRAFIADLVSMSKSGQGAAAAPDSQRLLRAIQENLDPAMGLAFVPQVVAASQLSVQRAHGLLIDLALRGQIELRPDAGTARFSDSELHAAPPGPDGSRLLWTRLVEGVT